MDVTAKAEAGNFATGTSKTDTKPLGVPIILCELIVW